jgi:hypothetical protein
MNKVTIPEQRSSMNDTDNFYSRKLSNGAVEYYSKEYYNPNFTRKSDELENIQKEILLYLIENSLE